MIFSQRYEDIIYPKGNVLLEQITMIPKDIGGSIDFKTRKKIATVLLGFAEPQKIKTSRYDNYEKATDAFEQVVDKLNEIIGGPIIDLEILPYETDQAIRIGGIFTPYLFDLIELQYIELSQGEQIEFQKAINQAMQDGEVPWILCDGRMIKIDSKQFEFDLREKALRELGELKDSDPKFQSAFQELTKAYSFLERGEYKEAILNAEKSYESVLKVICGLSHGNADRLTTEYIEKILNDLPNSIDKGGFREKIMMTLPYIRNHTDSGHGAGEKAEEISKPLAKLALNLSAALNTFLIEEHGKQLGESKEEDKSDL